MKRIWAIRATGNFDTMKVIIGMATGEATGQENQSLPENNHVTFIMCRLGPMSPAARSQIHIFVDIPNAFQWSKEQVRVNTM